MQRTSSPNFLQSSIVHFLGIAVTQKVIWAVFSRRLLSGVVTDIFAAASTLSLRLGSYVVFNNSGLLMPFGFFASGQMLGTRVREQVSVIFAALVRGKDLANGDASEQFDLQRIRVDYYLMAFADTQT